MLPVTTTSKALGAFTSCMAALSTYMCCSSTSGYWACTSVTTSFQNWKVSSTLALSTLVTFLLRLRAAWKATCAMRSISGPAVAHGVEGFLGAGEVAVGGDAAAARLAEVDVAGQLANDQDVQARHQFGLQAADACVSCS